MASSHAQLSTSITELENTLKAAFPDSKRTSSVYFIGYNEHLQLLEIVRQARDLSFKLQHGFVSCRLFVTAAPAPKATGNVFGTSAFGLDRVLGTERTVLLDA